MSQTAAATVQQAAERRPDQVAALAGSAQEPATARSHIRSPRTAPEMRAAAAYARETSRIQEAAAAQDRRAMARVDAVVQALKQPGAARAVVAGLPHRLGPLLGMKHSDELPALRVHRGRATRQSSS